MRRRIARRSLLVGTAATAVALRFRSGEAWGAPPPTKAEEMGGVDLDVRDIRVEGDRALARRFLLLSPKYLPRGYRMPLLVLLHGLGETVDETLGVRAWLDRYGLGTAFDRLRRPPVARTWKQRKDFSDERLAAVNAQLMQAPFYGFAIACPFTPKATDAKSLDAYAKWIVEVVVPRVRGELPIKEGAEHVALDGCSLGGFMGLEVFLRAPDAFGAWGGVQSAISEPTAIRYAERLAQVFATSKPKPLHIETSREDVFLKGNQRLSTELDKRGIKNDLLVIPGWHDQPWLREAGTLEMLQWHDRRFTSLP